MNNYCMIEVAFGNIDEVKNAQKELLENRLVASCQIINSNSVWRWKGEIEASSEYLMILKTKKELVKEIYDVIKKIHSYDCFEFAVIDITSCNNDYLDWIEKETK